MRGMVERVAREGQPCLTSDAQDDAWLSTRRSVMALGLRSIVCVPLQLKGTTLGVIYVDNRLQERELQVAREVQASLIPRQTPRVEGWKFAAFWQPARQVAGDFYDFIPIILAEVSEPSQG